MIKFKDLPLFGPDSSPQNTSEKIALIATGILWFIFFIVMFFIKPIQTKPKFKEVQIVLSSTPIEKKIQETSTTTPPAAASSAPASEVSKENTKQVVEEIAPPPVAKKEAKPVAKPKAEIKQTPKPTTKTPVKETAKPQSKSEPVVLSKSVEELMAEQFSNKKSNQKTADDIFASMDDPFEDFDETEPTTRTVNNSSTISGEAAKSTDSKAKSISSKSDSPSANKNVSNSTANALGKISNTKFLGTSSSDVDTESTVQTTANTTGKVSMVMANGSSRILLEPAKPIINLSENAAATIDGSRKVTIEFTVTESGNVPRGNILISPESILSEIVRKEIRDQISKWRFETATYTSKASFEYKIVKYLD